MFVHVLTRMSVLMLTCTLSVTVLAQDHTTSDAAGGHGQVAGHEAQAAPNPLNFEWLPYVSALIVFGLALFVLNRTAWPKITQGLNDRENKIRNDILQAQEARREAQEALAEYQKSLAEARNEAGRIIEQAKADQMKVVAELKARTEAEINQMRDHARRDIESARKQAVGEIYDQMAEVAVAIAGCILEKEISAADQQRLVEDSLNQLQPAGSGV